VFEDFFYKNHDPLFLVDRDLNLLDCNRAAGVFFGLSTEEIRARDMDELIDTSPFASLLASADLVDGWVRGRTLQYSGKSILPCDLRAMRLRPRSGGVSYAIEFARLSGDHQAFRDLRQTLAEANRRAEKSEQSEKQTEFVNRKLTSFAHRAAHDLKGPLSRIRQCLELFRLTEERGEDGGELLDLAENSAAQLYEMVNALLNYSKTREVIVERRQVRLKDLIMKVIQIVPDDELQEDWIRVDECGEVICDAALIQIVFQNLIENAIKYQDRLRPLRVDIICQVSALEMTVCVRDNGLGFPQELADQIFQLFERGHSHIDGAGIGLATTQEIITNHGWSISAKGKPGEGAEFAIRIPISDVCDPGSVT
tara:strand:+ start:13117 stop:14220 length:1104 start_codon:yes stop_codon:yes gene_type:complete